MVATSFKVKKVESTADMIIISPPRRRAAISELRAMYFSFMPISLKALGNQVPNAGIGEERQLAHGNAFDKLENRSEKKMDKLRIVFREE